MKLLARIVFWVLLVGGVVWGILYLTILEPWTIPSTDAAFTTSLLPNFLGDDLVILSRRNDAQVGWVVRCADPDAPGLFVMGRVLARAGETVDIQNGLARVDNHSPSSPTRCDEPKMTVRSPVSQADVELDCSTEMLGGTGHSILRGNISEKDTHVSLDSGAVFLVSDNRAMHMDSRDFGPLQANTCQHVLFRVWSTDDKRRLSLVW